MDMHLRGIVSYQFLCCTKIKQNHRWCVTFVPIVPFAGESLSLGYHAGKRLPTAGPVNLTDMTPRKSAGLPPLIKGEDRCAFFFYLLRMLGIFDSDAHSFHSAFYKPSNSN